MKIVILLLLFNSLYANIKQNMLNLYKNQEYKKVCIQGASKFTKFRKDESLISLYAFACLKSNFIDKLSIPIVILKNSKEARSNSAYFSIILMQKKLLYKALIDGYNLSLLNLPTTTYLFSKVFDMYVQLGEHTKQEFYIFEDEEDKKRSYKLYVQKYKNSYSIIIEEFFNNLKIKRNIYK